MRKFLLRVSKKQDGLDDAVSRLCAGASRDEVIERAIQICELDPDDDSLGFGGFPNLLGRTELDACFMDGNSRACGAVAGISNYLPVRVARRLMQEELHTLLIGEGAARFAREAGIAEEPTLSPAQRERWKRVIEPILATSRDGQSLSSIVRKVSVAPVGNLDTTVMIASDGHGMSGAGSTSGWPYKHPGRVGDTPVIGAGLYVDSRFGGACCTYTGEMTMRGSAARYIVAQMAGGKSPRAALQAAADDISHLRGGVLRAVVLHAVDRDGAVAAIALNADFQVKYFYWQEGMGSLEEREVEYV